ncbi:DUF4349 domain-containing protein [Monashia sp. NPDC004114]
MTALTPSRRSRLDLVRSRPILIALAVLAVIAIAIPVGLKTIHASGDVATSGGAAASSFAESDAAPKAPQAARDAAGQGTSGAAGAPSAAGANGNSSDSLGAAAGTIEPKLARSAWLGIRVSDLTGASAQARAIATSAGGRVTSENIVTATDPTGGYGVPSSGSVSPGVKEDVATVPVGVDQARMTLSVPEEKLDGALLELSRLGTVAYRSSQTEDVTDTYVDVKARIAPAQESIDQVRRLLSQAKDLQQIILLEQELNRRQADLDSLTQQLASLEQRTTMSDVTLTMWTDQTAPAQTSNGFVDGLRTAWDGLLSSVTVILTGLAALLPWLLVLGLLAWFGLRIYRRRTGTVAPAPAGATVGAAPSPGPAPSTGAAPTSGPATSGTATSGAATTPDPTRPPSDPTRPPSDPTSTT